MEPDQQSGPEQGTGDAPDRGAQPRPARAEPAMPRRRRRLRRDVIMSKLPRRVPSGPPSGGTRAGTPGPPRRRGPATGARRAKGAAPARRAKRARARRRTAARPKRARHAPRCPPGTPAAPAAVPRHAGFHGEPPPAAQPQRSGSPQLALDGAIEAVKLPLRVGGRLTLRALDAVARGLRGAEAPDRSAARPARPRRTPLERSCAGQPRRRPNRCRSATRTAACWRRTSWATTTYPASTIPPWTALRCALRRRRAAARRLLRSRWTVSVSRAPAVPMTGVLEAGQAIRISTGAMVPREPTQCCASRMPVRAAELVGAPRPVTPGNRSAAPARTSRRRGRVTGREPGRPRGARRCGLDRGGRAVLCAAAPRRDRRHRAMSWSTPRRDWRPARSATRTATPSRPRSGRRGTALPVETVGDDTRDDGRNVERALSADVVVTTGGVSVGPTTTSRPALAELGVEQVFWGVALRPGHPTWFGTRDPARSASASRATPYPRW